MPHAHDRRAPGGAREGVGRARGSVFQHGASRIREHVRRTRGGLRRSPRRAPVVSFQGSETLVATGAPGPAEVGKGGDGEAAAAAGADGQPLSKNALKKLQKEKEIAEKKAKKAAEKKAAAAAGN